MEHDIQNMRDVEQRKALLRVCAEATEGEMEAALACFPARLEPSDLRPPETGLVMVRGRIGGVGNAFNVGEAVVTRASLMLRDGRVGHSYLLGRSKTKARMAAIIDALGQDPDDRRTLEEGFVARVMHRVAQEAATVREEVASTRVSFFTLARGDDQ